MAKHAVLVRLAAIFIAAPFIAWGFFALAGRWNWPAGWGCLVLLFVGGTARDLLVWWKNPELARRRVGTGKGTKRWDIACLSGFGILYVATVVVGVLDGGRFAWSTMPAWLWPVGAALYLVSEVVITWSMTVNTHFEKTARIQSDRGHSVVRSGPYAVIRHPGYLAAITGFNLATPLLLLSWWAFVPGLLSSAVIVARTALEDRMLSAELPGYADYAREVRYRLVPGLW